MHLDRRIRQKLAASLEHLFDRSRSRTGVDDIDFPSIISEITEHRQRSGVYARYFDLVFALNQERYQDAATLWRELAAMVHEAPHLEVKLLTPESMGADAERYARLMNAGEPTALLASPKSTHWNAFDRRVESAFKLLHEADDALADETRTLVCEVIGAVSASPASNFGSASSLTLWGAIVLNIERHRSALDLADGLIHESSHLLLFGYAADEPLVSNEIDERFSSPLRADPRPMDGVVHATFVCARRYLFYRRILENGAASAFETSDDVVAERLDRHRRKFVDGAATIAAYGKLTNVGKDVIQATSAYMASPPIG